jgi:hypothetical protein
MSALASLSAFVSVPSLRRPTGAAGETLMSVETKAGT